MEIDNFEQITKLIPPKSDQYYFVEILKRRKRSTGENPNYQGKDKLHSYMCKDLNEIKDSVIRWCNEHNARAYIKLGLFDVLDYKLNLAIELLTEVATKNTKLKNLADSVASHTGNNKWRILDADDYTQEMVDEFIQRHKGFMEVLDVIKTPNGFHIVCKWVNTSKVSELNCDKSRIFTILYSNITCTNL